MQCTLVAALQAHQVGSHAGQRVAVWPLAQGPLCVVGQHMAMQIGPGILAACSSQRRCCKAQGMPWALHAHSSGLAVHSCMPTKIDARTNKEQQQYGCALFAWDLITRILSNPIAASTESHVGFANISYIRGPRCIATAYAIVKRIQSSTLHHKPTRRTRRVPAACANVARPQSTDDPLAKTLAL